MSISLPIIEPRPEFIDDLLREQGSLTAVERFSRVHAEQTTSGPAQARYYRDLMPTAPPGPGEQYAFEVDLDRCTGCKSCVVACHTLNGLEETEAWRRVGTVATGATQLLDWIEELPRTDNQLPIEKASQTQSSRIQHVTTACHHCADPGCLSGCPVNAYDKDPVTGVVRHWDDQCIGCKYCTMMCPYEVPRYSERLGIVRKCDMCHQRLSVGEAPACVQACPNEAIAIRRVQTTPDDTSEDVRTQQEATPTRLAPGAAPSSITRPTTIYKTEHPEWFQSAIAQDYAIDPVAESHAPLAWLLIATQMSVGLLLCERLGAFAAWGMGIVWSPEVTRLSSLFSLIIALAGLGVAPLHLGQPLRAWRIFLGLRTSWLSREAVLLGQYAGMLGVVVLLAWADVVASWLPEGFGGRNLLAAIPSWGLPVGLAMTIPVGLAGLYCSGMIYIVTRRVLWRAERTFLRCAGSLLIGGLAGLSVVLCLGGQGVHPSADPGILFPLWLGLAVLTQLKLTWEYRVFVSQRGIRDEYDARSRVLLNGPLRKTVKVRFVCGAAGLVLMLFCLLLTGVADFSPASVLVGVLACLAAGLLVLGELLERLLYFSSVVYDRMPGTLR